MKTEVLAFLCRVCPVCNIVRRWPDTGFAKMMIKAEKNCPACKAYRQLYGWPASGKVGRE